MSRDRRKDLTVVIPCYNEEGRIGNFFSLIRDNAHLDWEWIFIDDGSLDGTRRMLESFSAENAGKAAFHSLPANCGKGRAVREGFLRATGRLVGFVDADLSASPLEFQRYLGDPGLAAGRKMIVGLRLLTQDGIVERTFFRHFVGRCFQTYTSVVTGLKVYDTQCGFKLVERELARKLASRMRTDGFAFDVELILLARKMGVQIAEERISWKEMGNSRVRPHHALTMAYEILKIRRRVAGLSREKTEGGPGEPSGSEGSGARTR